ncbi:DUF4097 and DUF4098 domain-containing protein YvlB/TM2 domain-containing membrane protein YozV [Paenibacillus anaericanus]|uniref:DUF4097 family beta strand repeat-containing protein n=1 Tax=Paenibacillus anaericanus TaxID=170367 RepID=UPI00278AEAA7|nr:DUF4097 family beta strand repeat-containing protein [Paenibacillus anaericanus]MDQ0091237.1 DUF4097 and DUF4098 domain-containing protein YvlB/TM2 domain-containing membrane protein YozV [Paenibacillus anaericanus]
MSFGSTPTTQQTERATSAQTKGFKPRRRKRKFIACLLSALFPGLGHLYLRMFMKGVAFIYFVIIDISALIYFSSVRMGINVPLLLLLGLLIPAAYFYSIYDVLQSTDVINTRIRRQNEENIPREEATRPVSGIRKGIWSAILLISGGIVVFLFKQKPAWLQSLIQAGAGYIVASGLILVGLFLILREGRRRFFRTGRFTASVLFIAVGIILLSDTFTDGDNMLLLLDWWPLVLVLSGVEHVLVLLWNRRNTPRPERRLRADIKGVFLSLFMVFSVFVVTQQDHYMHLWNRVSLDLASAGAEYSLEEGYRVDKIPLEIPIDLDTEKVVVDGVNGSIDVKRAEIEGIIVKATVWVDQVSDEEAEIIADETFVGVAEGQSLGLTVKDKLYGATGKRHPRTNLTIILPENRFLDLDISTSSGGISLTGAQARNHFKLQTGNGNLKLWDVVGEVSAKTLNGDVDLYRIFGSVNVDTQGGNMKGRGISGGATLSTLVGNISLVGSQGDINLSTKNGNIQVDGALSALRAESLNGKISISSEQVGGDWGVYSAVGEMFLKIPEGQDYTLEGSSGYGNIVTELPFLVENKEIKGVMGTGEHLIKVEGNSNLVVNKSVTRVPLVENEEP